MQKMRIMWGNHCEFLFSNRHYGNGGAYGEFEVGFTARMQFTDYENEFANDDSDVCRDAMHCVSTNTTS